MRKYRIVFSETADRDLDDIVAYLSSFSADTALRYYDELIRKSKSLNTMPERCPFVSDDELCEKGFRWLFVQNYTVFFVVEHDKNAVDIRRILYAGRDYTALL